MKTQADMDDEREDKGRCWGGSGVALDDFDDGSGKNNEREERKRKVRSRELQQEPRP